MMNFKSNKLHFIAMLCAALLAAWIGYSFRETVEITQAAPGQPTITVQAPTPTLVYPRGYTGATGQNGQAGATTPTEIVVTPIEGPMGPPGADGVTQTVVLIDTFRVAVPAAIARDSTNVRLTSQNPVTVRAPLFGSPTVSVQTYNPNTSQYEELKYKVRPNPVQYGAEIEAFGAAPLVETGDLGAFRVGVGGRVYLGYRGVQPFAGVQVTTEGVSTRFGIRYRLGR